MSRRISSSHPDLSIDVLPLNVMAGRRRKLAYNVPEFCEATGLGKTSVWDAIKSGKLPSVLIAGRRLILARDGIRWLQAGRDQAA